MSQNLIIISIYLLTLPIIGYLKRAKIHNEDDYFLGGKKAKWWAVSFSIVAEETSSLTFISLPGIAYLGNLNFLQLVIGYIIGRTIVAFFFLPKYWDGKIYTAYHFLEIRFGSKIRKIASSTFLFTRLAADGVRLFATAIPVKLLLGIQYHEAILIIIVIAMIYSLIGGMQSVIWVDVWQMFIYIGGAIIAVILLINSEQIGNVSAFFSSDVFSSKSQIFNFDFSNLLTEPYNLFAAIFGGMFLSMSSHGTDQLIIQRLLNIKKIKDAQRSIILSGIVVFLQMSLFLFIGILLFKFSGGAELKPDEVFTKFILEEVPNGLSGIIIAGLLAAAISTISGSMTAMASSTFFDLTNLSKLENSKKVKYSRLLTVVWAILLFSSAIYFSYSNKQVIEIALGIASFTYSGLLSIFLLAIFDKTITENEIIFVFISIIILMTVIILFTNLAWTWYIFTGVIAAFLISLTLKMIRNVRNN